MSSESDTGGRHRGLISLNIDDAKGFLRQAEQEESKWFAIGGLDSQLIACTAPGFPVGVRRSSNPLGKQLSVAIRFAFIDGFAVLPARFKASCRLRMRISKGDDLQATYEDEWTVQEPCNRRNPRVFGSSPLFATVLILASHSEDFETMFFGEFAERGKDEVELKDVDAADFHCFKDLTHPPHAAVDDTNVASVVCMADKYRAATMLQKCEEAIISRMDPTDAFKVPSGLGLDQVFPLNPIYCRAQILRAMTDEELDEFSEADVCGALSKQTIWVLMHEYKNRRDNA